jgi:hypothetical protein
MPDLPEGHVCHLTNGRVRVKIPEKRRDEAFFNTVRERLGSWSSIEAVEVNPLTASVLVHFRDLGALFAENAMKNELFTIDFEALKAEREGPRRSLTAWARQRWIDADNLLRRYTDGNADIRSAAFLIAVVGALVQLSRGQIAPPAATLFWDAGEMLRVWRTTLDEQSETAPEKVAAEG